MTVYVDESIFPFRGTFYCHVWADSLAELHTAAQSVGLKREWFQAPPKASWEHYDCAPRIRQMLVDRGAVETDKFGPLVWEAALKVQSNNPHVIKLGWSRIMRYRQIRLSRPCKDLFAPVFPEIDFPAAQARFAWFRERERDLLQWWLERVPKTFDEWLADQ